MSTLVNDEDAISTRALEGKVPCPRLTAITLAGKVYTQIITVACCAECSGQTVVEKWCIHDPMILAVSRQSSNSSYVIDQNLGHYEVVVLT